MGDEQSIYRQFLIDIHYPDNLVSVEVAWVSQQKAGTSRKIMDLVKFLKGYIDEKR